MVHAVACFAAGLVTAAAVAWVGPLAQVGWGWGQESLLSDTVGGIGAENWVWSSCWIFTRSPHEVDTRANLAERHAQARSMRPTRPSDPDVNPFLPPVTWDFVESGWPRRAFWGWQMHDRNLRPQGSGIVKLRMLRPSPRVRQIEVPYLPIWSGLMVNSAFFGAGWWLVLAGPWAVRRAWRRRRRRCVACGYEMKGLERCPECGVVERVSGGAG